MKILFFIILSFFSSRSFACYYDYTHFAHLCLSVKDLFIGVTGTYGELNCYGEPHVGCTSTRPDINCHNMEVDGGCCLVINHYTSKELLKRCEPGEKPPIYQGNSSFGSNHNECGSVINVDGQVLSELIPIANSPFKLVYSSNRVKGYKNNFSVRIPITGNDFLITPEHDSVDLEIEIAGQYFTYSYFPVAGLYHDFVWDGKDDLGNPVDTSQIANVRITFNYTAPHRESAPRELKFPLGLSAINEAITPGWDVNVRHVYDLARKVLYKGDGTFFASDYYERADGSKIVLSTDRREAYIFDVNFRHVETRDFITGYTKLSFVYDSFGKIISILDAYSKATTFQYSSGIISSATSPYGQVTTIVTDTSNRIVSTTNSLLEEYSMTYNSDDLLTTFLKPNGNSIAITYDSSGKVISDVNSSGPEVNIDTSGSLPLREISVTSATGLEKIIQITSGENDYNRVVQYPDYRTEEYQETHGMIRSKKKDNSVFTLYLENDSRFDEKFKRIASQLLNYESQGALVTLDEAVSLNSADPLDVNIYSKTTTIETDVYTQTYTSSTDSFVYTSPLGRTIASEINPQGSITKLQSGSLLPIELTYNSQGQAVLVKQGVRETMLEYSPVHGEATKVTNSLLQETSFSYNMLGRMTSMTLPDSRVIGFNYDFNGNLTSLTPAGRPTHELTYNGLGYLQSYLPPTIGLPSSSTTYLYNNDRKLSSISRPNGDSITYNYDISSGNFTSLNFPTGSRYFSYSVGGISNASSEDGVYTSFDYVSGFKASELVTSPSNSYYFMRDLNTKYLLSTETLNVGVRYLIFNYTYDNDGLLIQAGPLSLSRDVNLGIITSLSSESAEVEFTYSTNYGELSGIKSIFNSTTNTYETSYTRDLLGRVSTLTETYQSSSPVSYEYIYDSTGRLLEVKLGSIVEQAYSYDSNSNRISQTIGTNTTTATYDDQDRLLTFGSKTFTYNANGELLTETDGVNTKHFTYDVFGNLKSIVLPTKTINYQVDAFNRRVVRLEGTAPTDHYIWVDDKIIGTADALGSLTARFIYGSKDHVPDYMITDTAEYMIVTNHLGSPVQVIDVNSGVIVQEIKYNVWGEIISDTNPGFQPFGFAGCLYDQDTKLCRFGARDYDASIGRWLSKDPILFNGGDTNLFGYVMQDPINFIDSSGEIAVPVAAVLIGGTIAGVINAGATYATGGTTQDTLRAFGSGFLGGAVGAIGVATGGLITGLVAIPLGVGTTVLTSTYEGGDPAGIHKLVNRNIKMSCE